MRTELAVIRKALADVWESQGRSFATFEIADDEDADRWVQYLDGELNLKWPFDEELSLGLARRGVALPAGAFCGWHAPGENAVIEVGDVAIDDVALLVESLFLRVLAAAGGSERPFRISARVLDHA